MIRIGIRFPAGRYHATPWGRFYNEGVREWPPSPYRLLRAIIAAWKYNLPELDEQDMFPILQKLASAPPRFYLPPSSAGHTRHYMPNQKGRTLVMDTFSVVDKEAVLYFVWPSAELTGQESATLGQVLGHLHYLGRSESWCDAALGGGPAEPNCFPASEAGQAGGRPVEVLVPLPDVTMENLYVETASMRARGKRRYPAGSALAAYLDASAEGEPEPAFAQADVEAVRYAIASAVRPPVTETLRIAELMRGAAQSAFGKLNGHASSPTFSGKDANGEALRGHSHASYLPTDEDSDGMIDHITVVAKRISTERGRELDSLLAVRALWDPRLFDGRIDLALQGYGSRGDFVDVPIFGESARWRSATPLVLSRHMKERGPKGNRRLVDTHADQIKRELLLRRGIKDVVVGDADYKGPVPGSRFRPSQYKRLRKRYRSGGQACSTVISFRKPVRGPLLLGYASHFGLGMFVPDADSCAVEENGAAG